MIPPLVRRLNKQIQDLLGQYWAHPEMSADAARKQFASIIAGSQ
jgi:hypothetical protein